MAVLTSTASETTPPMTEWAASPTDQICSRNGATSIAERASANREDVRVRCQRTVWIPSKESSRQQSERASEGGAARACRYSDVSGELRRGLWRNASRTWAGPSGRNHERCACIAHPPDGRHTPKSVPCRRGQVQVQALLCRQLCCGPGHRIQSYTGD